MNFPLFRVDAFTDKLFAGNPAAVCPLVTWLPDETMRGIAAENNLPETAFFVPQGDNYRLRWFTPRYEVNLCGHATLASAHVIFNILEPARTAVTFETRSGSLLVRREGELLAMDFPAIPAWTCTNPPAELIEGLGRSPERVLQVKDNYFAVYADEDQVQEAKPNFLLLEKLHPAGVCITAPGSDADFVSRYFAPSYGVREDPVTGSTHCSLAPYWAERLGKQHMHARQLSARGGGLWCEMQGERVIIKGNAILYLAGTMTVG